MSCSYAFLQVVPEGFRKVLAKFKSEYDNPEIIVTENGFSDYGEIDDSGRINYFEVRVYTKAKIRIFNFYQKPTILVVFECSS